VSSERRLPTPLDEVAELGGFGEVVEGEGGGVGGEEERIGWGLLP